MTEDTKATADALAYVTEIYRELAQENGYPTLGTQNQVVDFVLSEAPLREAAQGWAERVGGGEAKLEPHERPPRDAAFWRVRERLQAVMEKPTKFGEAPPADRAKPRR